MEKDQEESGATASTVCAEDTPQLSPYPWGESFSAFSPTGVTWYSIHSVGRATSGYVLSRAPDDTTESTTGSGIPTVPDGPISHD